MHLILALLFGRLAALYFDYLTTIDCVCVECDDCVVIVSADCDDEFQNLLTLYMTHVLDSWSLRFEIHFSLAMGRDGAMSRSGLFKAFNKALQDDAPASAAYDEVPRNSKQAFLQAWASTRKRLMRHTS